MAYDTFLVAYGAVLLVWVISGILSRAIRLRRGEAAPFAVYPIPFVCFVILLVFRAFGVGAP